MRVVPGGATLKPVILNDGGQDSIAGGHNNRKGDRSLAPSITDWISAAATSVSAVVAIFLLYQLYLAKEQLALTQAQLNSGIKWNQMNAVFTYFGMEEYAQRRSAVAEVLKKQGIEFEGRREALAPEIVEVLMQGDNYGTVQRFLNYLEYCAAVIRTGVAEPNTSYALMGGIITIQYGVFRPFIEKRRELTNNLRVWAELEKLALDWQIRRTQEASKLEEQLQEARERSAREQNKVLDNIRLRETDKYG
jgi:hypothetical protein